MLQSQILGDTRPVLVELTDTFNSLLRDLSENLQTIKTKSNSLSIIKEDTISNPVNSAKESKCFVDEYSKLVEILKENVVLSANLASHLQRIL